MYINRTERIERPIERLRRAPRANGEKFAETIESLIEMDVVEIGDSTEEKKKQQQNGSEQKQQSDQEPRSPVGEMRTLDIKA